MRLPGTSNETMPATAPSIDSGITAATSKPARTLPSSKSKTITTSAAPSSRLVATVRSVASTRMLRS